MRTTLTLDQDVLEKAKALAVKRKEPFKTVINEALRIGLSEVEKPAPRRPCRTKSYPMGLRKGFNLDNIGELLAQSEGEDFK